jgi:hypothetical protein
VKTKKVADYIIQSSRREREWKKILDLVHTPFF